MLSQKYVFSGIFLYFCCGKTDCGNNELYFAYRVGDRRLFGRCE